MNARQGFTKLNMAQRLRRMLGVPDVRRPARQTTQSRGDRPRLVVEAMEPRYLLSGEGLLPPTPDLNAGVVLHQPLVLTPAASSHVTIATGQDMLASQLDASRGVWATAEDRQQQVGQINEVIFVDPRVQDADRLIAQALSQRSAEDESQATRAEVVVLDAQSDGLEQITRWLARYDDLQAIHLVSHGDDGSLLLGTTLVNADKLDAQAEQFASWRQALSADADLLIYGCDVGKGERGERFVSTLSELTGADVAASIDATGSAVAGGNWTLERRVGAIESTTLFAFGPAFNADAFGLWAPSRPPVPMKS